MTLDEALYIADRQTYPDDFPESDNPAVALAREVRRLREELVSELRSELALANAYCANATIKHCEERLRSMEA